MPVLAWSVELALFALLQARAALFGGLLLAFMLVSHFLDLPLLHRYDHIFLFAVLVQIFLLASGQETAREAGVIFGFHCVATVMELYKTSAAIGSWHYPEEAVFALFNVPLFAGFMYSAVGSYIARAWTLLALRFTTYPRFGHTLCLAALIYANFFSHHFMVDLRYLLVGYAMVLFWRTRVAFHGASGARHAAAGRLRARLGLRVDRRKRSHLCRGLALPAPARRLDAGLAPQARRLVPADDRQFRAGVAA